MPSPTRSAPARRRRPDAPAVHVVAARLTDEEHRGAVALAAELGLDLSTLVRRLLSDATAARRPRALDAPPAPEATPAHPALPAALDGPPVAEGDVSAEGDDLATEVPLDGPAPMDVVGVDLVLEVVKRSADASGVGLAAVAEVVLELERLDVARDDAHRALAALVLAGRIDLRPRRAVDVRGAELCPAGERPGFVLAYARPR